MLVIDFEVFKYDWLCVILDLEEKQIHEVVNDVEKLTELYEANKKRIWIGYNINHYDKYIFQALLTGNDPKAVNDWIIVQGQSGWAYSRDFNKYPLITFDCMERIDRGLKFLEGSMGHKIYETSVPFDIDRKLTEEEIREVLDYCQHDVEETVDVFIQRYSDFEARMGLVKEYELGLSAISKTKARLSSDILGAKSRGGEFSEADKDAFDLDLPPTLVLGEKYRHIADWYMNPENHDYSKKLVTNVAGVEHIFAWGGIHGAREKYSGDGIYVMADVASLYPSLMIEYDLMSRSVPDPAKYRKIRDQRLGYKASGDPRQAGLKLVLNSAYGILKDKYSAMYDPRQANRVCIYGQLLLLDLIEKVEWIPGVELIQSNTDGILVKLPDWDAYDVLDDVCHEWEKRTRLDLEFENYVKVAQKDVNNYVIVSDEGKVKTKGGWVKALNDLDYDLPIVNKALVRWIAEGVIPEITINECDDLREFQMIHKASHKYDGIWHGDVKLNERVVRCYASTRSSDKGLTKVHLGRGNRVKCAGTPERAFIDNGDVTEKKVPNHLDRQWYIKLCRERGKEFGIR